MATTDVPGANPANGDDLHVGCWASHEDGSLIFVKGVESDRVVYELFDTSRDPPMQLTDAMPERGFKKAFSYPGKSGERWTWRDKTSFPWDRVMGTFKPGAQYPSVGDQVSAARRAADRLGLRVKTWRPISREDIEHLGPAARGVVSRMLSRLQAAIDRQPRA